MNATTHTAIAAAFLAAVSTFHCYRAMVPDGNALAWSTRITHTNKCLDASAEAPYRYRVLPPMALSAALKVADWDGRHPLRWASACCAVYFVAALWMFSACYAYWFAERGRFTALAGCALIAILMPAMNSSPWDCGDVTIMAVFATGLLLAKRGKWWALVPLCAIGATCREQVVVLPVVAMIGYGALSAKTIVPSVVASASVIAVHLLIVAWRGYAPNAYTVAFHLQRNFTGEDALYRTPALWLVAVAPFVAATIYRLRDSSARYRIWAAFLCVYVCAFAAKGYLWELEKFLPAYLLMIPVIFQPPRRASE